MSQVEQNDEGFELLLRYLEDARGFDFSSYKRSSLMRRMTKRIQMVGVSTFAEYVDFLEVHPEEFSLLFNSILINVTSFFRDQLAWDFLLNDVARRIIETKQSGAHIRIWSAGCASGEEAYSLAMAFSETMGTDQFRQRVKVYATDVDEEALTQARQAAYSPNHMEGVPAEMVQKYFDLQNGQYVFNKDLRHSVIFGRHDLLQDAPISRVDLLVCRNTLMYFNAEAQSRVLSRFEFALNDGGYLFLGKAEVMLSRIHIFTPVDLKRRIFMKVGRRQIREQNYTGIQAMSQDEQMPLQDTQNLLRKAALETDPSAQVVINAAGILSMANDSARALLGMRPGDIGLPLTEIDLSHAPISLRNAITLFQAEHHYRMMREVEWTAGGDDHHFYDVTLLPLLDEQRNYLGVKIVFVDVSRVMQLQDQLQHSHRELETANEELQSSNEELETTNEELQSTVEELETTNEELQSSNEELETINEELQSTNEELETTNQELRRRSDDIGALNALLGSILSGLQDGVIVVDRNLCILAWNARSEDMWGMRSDEARGMHLMNLDVGIPLEQLIPTIRACLAGEKANDTLTLDAINRRGKAIRIKVKCNSLARQGYPIQGAILLVSELSDNA